MKYKETKIRKPFRSGSFYPNSAYDCKAMLNNYIDEPYGKKYVAGIVPHAGWIFSGKTAGYVYSAFKNNLPDTFIVFGAVHVGGVEKPVLYPEGSWDSSLGNIKIDNTVNSFIKEKLGNLIIEDDNLHKFEHSIEVQIPFIKHISPNAGLVAIMIPPSSDSHEIGRVIGEVVASKNISAVALGSSDFTHYGANNFGFAPKGNGYEALKWVKEENDRKLINKIISMKDNEIVAEAENKFSACGSGAIAATVGYAKSFGIKFGELLDYTTSFDVMPEGEPTDFVGYAGIVF